MRLHDTPVGLQRPHDLLDKLRRDFVQFRRIPWDPYLAFNFFATAAHLPSWIEVAGGPNACQLPPTPLLKAVWQIVDGEAPLKLTGAIPAQRHLVVELDGWPARTLGVTVKAVDLASQVMTYWETLECFPENPEGAGRRCPPPTLGSPTHSRTLEDHAVQPIPTRIPGFTIRFAVEQDVPLILSFIKALAAYEKLSHEVSVTEELLRETLFKRRRVAEVLIGEYRGDAVGFALFFHNYSTFLGLPGIYLEDLFVQPEMRGRGFGKALLTYLAKLATERQCGRVEWSVLDWNEPSIQFYQNLGAVAKDEWTMYRLTGQALTNVAQEF